MLESGEKQGKRLLANNRRELFRDFLNTTGLMDLEFQGCKFTWMSHPRGGSVTREKLDRVVVNYSLRTLFPHALAVALPIISSNHSPIIFHLTPPASSGVDFKFEAKWADHAQCAATVEEGWRQGVENSSPWETVLEKRNRAKEAWCAGKKGCSRGLMSN